MIGEDVILSRLDLAIEAAAVRDRITAKGLDEEAERFTIEDYPVHVWEDEGGAVSDAA